MKYLSVSTIAAIAAIALASNACQAQSPSTIQIVDGPISQTQDRPPRGPSPFADLNLTAEQRSKISEIRKKTRTEIEKILTAEQKAQLRTAMQNRKPPSPGMQGPPPDAGMQGPPPGAGMQGPPGMTALNLSDEQEQKIQNLVQSEREQISNILTAEQREKLRQRPMPR
ncbi:MAG: hypothetical protein HC866_03275 [Leptolyngbyaceae cyanobacterium RU_5_1]|nr:hypothetical protein [Leptolyngbyaceae cyanobacterium RU_5_1]